MSKEQLEKLLGIQIEDPPEDTKSIAAKRLFENGVNHEHASSKKRKTLLMVREWDITETDSQVFNAGISFPYPSTETNNDNAPSAA